MAPVRSKKQASEQALTSPRKLAMAETVPLRAGSPSAYPRSPIKRRTPGTITMQQKQAMIDNMQLEITERARRLRAQYSFMATTVRSRVEMRINRIPMSMRNVKMGDLLQKFLEQEQQRATRSAALRKAVVARTSPQKQLHSAAHAARGMTRTKKRMSDAISGDKENEIEHNENMKKRVRATQNPDVAHVRPAQILSPTSSNSRLANRSRPASPVKNFTLSNSHKYAFQHGGKGKGHEGRSCTQGDDRLDRQHKLNQHHSRHSNQTRGSNDSFSSACFQVDYENCS
ncbi:hypothetical protein Neosp_006285 [[Neocosmospora] mangrovei]